MKTNREIVDKATRFEWDELMMPKTTEGETIDKVTRFEWDELLMLKRLRQSLEGLPKGCPGLNGMN